METKQKVESQKVRAAAATNAEKKRKGRKNAKMAKNGPKNAKKTESAVGIGRLPNPVTRFLTPFGRYHWGIFAEIHSGPKKTTRNGRHPWQIQKVLKV